MVASGKLPSANVGRCVRIDFRTFEADLERQVSGQAPVSRAKGMALSGRGFNSCLSRGRKAL
jgi:hypothetical protein